jgi:hypothetical protein
VPDATAVNDVFITPGERPRLVFCAVLFLDLLGVSEMAGASFPEASEHLERVERALRGAYRDVLEHGLSWSGLLISDTLVLAAPLPGGEDGDAAPEDLTASTAAANVLGGLVDQAARVQSSLLDQQLFSRGGLTVGWVHLHDGFVFGPALAEAYRLESRVAVHPRIVVGPKAAEALARDARGGGSAAAHRLRRDRDGLAFVDYLQVVLEDPADVTPRLRLHREQITRALAASADDRRVWEKYQWLADYHNAVIAQSDLRNGRDELLVAPEDLAWGFAPFPGPGD